MNHIKWCVQQILHSKNQTLGRRNNSDPCKKYIPVTNCLFDLDGVILDNQAILDELYKSVFTTYNLEYNKDWRHKIFGMTAKGMWEEVIKEFKLKTKWEEMNSLFLKNMAKSKKVASVKPGVEKVLNHLESNNIPTALVTSMSREAMHETTKHIQNILSKFQVVACGDDPDILKSKPHRDIYLMTSRRFEGMPDGEKCLAFEDTINGIASAQIACMQTVAIPSPPITTDMHLRHADQVLHSLEEFRPGKYGLPKYKEKIISRSP